MSGPRRLWVEINGEPWLINPAGTEALTVVGALNPARASRRGRPMARRRARVRRPRSGWRRNDPARRRRRAFRLFNDPDPARRSRRRVYYRRRRRNDPDPDPEPAVAAANPRRRRRNPPIALAQPQTWLPYAVNAGLSVSVATTLPAALWGADVTGGTAYATQGASAVLGALAANWLMQDDGTHAMVWFLTHAGVIVADMIGKTLVGQVFGFARGLVRPAAPVVAVPTADGGTAIVPATAAPAAAPALAGFGQPYAFRARYYPTAMAPYVARR